MANATPKTLEKLIDKRNRRALPGLVETHNGMTRLANAVIVGEKERKSSCFGAAVSALLLVGGLVAMFGASKPEDEDERPEYATDEHIEFLNGIAGQHRVDLLSWRYLQETFTDLTVEQAVEVMGYWHRIRWGKS